MLSMSIMHKFCPRSPFFFSPRPLTDVRVFKATPLTGPPVQA